MPRHGNETTAKAEQPKPKATRKTTLQPTPPIRLLKEERGFSPLGPGRSGAFPRMVCSGFYGDPRDSANVPGEIRACPERLFFFGRQLAPRGGPGGFVVAHFC